MSVQTLQNEPWPVWAKVMVTLLMILVVATIVPWLFMSIAMAAGCAGMMGGQMPTTPMMH